jgi:hypothetical protein
VKNKKMFLLWANVAQNAVRRCEWNKQAICDGAETVRRRCERLGKGGIKTMGKFVDLTGRRYGALLVLHRTEDVIAKNGKHATMWLCRCDCGKEIKIKPYSLTSGHSKSCGCKIIKHGFSHKEALYETWRNMKRRCLDPKNKRYAHYGEKGVFVCEEWEKDYSKFREWAYANGYSKELTIDRINNNGNYEPANCRWATPKQQENNMSRNRMLEYEGAVFTMSEWADMLRLPYGTINHRVQRGWTMDEIVNTPKGVHRDACKTISARVSRHNQ